MSDKNIVSKSAGKFTEHYDDNPLTALLLTTLSLIIPQIAIGKEAIDRAVTKIQKERFTTLIDELAKGEKLLTPEVIESEEFIHSFVVVYRAAMNTYQREKIRMFARILTSAVQEGELATDKFEIYVKLLEDATYLEISILGLLEELEDQYVSNNLNEFSPRQQSSFEVEYVQRALYVTTIIWDEFTSSATQLFGLDSTELGNILKRLDALGLYHLEAVRRSDSEGFTNIGTPTLLFKSLSEWITDVNKSHN